MDAYDDANAENDLAVFSKQFNLPACTSSNGCFRKIYSSGRKPSANANWAVEISLDIEWAHAIAPQAKIMLIETPSNNLSDLVSGVDFAVRNGCVGCFHELDFSGIFRRAQSGQSLRRQWRHFPRRFRENGQRRELSCSIALRDRGRRHFADAGSTGNYSSEAAWSGSGGGLSNYENEPLDQAQFPIAG